MKKSSIVAEQADAPGSEPGAHGREGSNPSDRTTVAPRGRNFSRPEDRKSRSGAAQHRAGVERMGTTPARSLNRRKSDDDATTIKNEDLQRSASVVTQVSVPEKPDIENTVKLGPGESTEAWIHANAKVVISEDPYPAAATPIAEGETVNDPERQPELRDRDDAGAAVPRQRGSRRSGSWNARRRAEARNDGVADSPGRARSTARGPFSFPRGPGMATHEHGTGAIVGGHCDLAIPTHYNGRRYASRMEARFAERLDLEQRAGIVRSWKPQVRLALEIPDVAGGPPITVAHYSVDFLVVYATGETHAIETKGKWTREAMLKRRIFEATWPARTRRFATA